MQVIVNPVYYNRQIRYIDANPRFASLAKLLQNIYIKVFNPNPESKIRPVFGQFLDLESEYAIRNSNFGFGLLLVANQNQKSI